MARRQSVARQNSLASSFAGDEITKQKHLGVLFTGNLEKLNPYGKMYRTRFVVLTNENFHWFKVNY
jgi:hypothetical protein